MSANQAPTAHSNETSYLSQPDDKRLANAIRALSMDAVEKANSGHPGMPMGMADVATVLYRDFLKFDASTPEWADRDRFILSAGHGSMLLYALNYLTGYKEMTLEQIKSFRQLGSIAAGHPEVHHSAGIEMTTGPLGQGISTAVGFALAERIQHGRFGQLVDHKTYVIASDGDLMEGISHEACSLAGHMKLNNLIVMYDDNGISIDGPTSLSFSENIPQRFESYGWATETVDGHNHAQIREALTRAQTSDKPVLISCKTRIGYGAPTKENSSSSHGSPLGKDELAGAKSNLDWAHGAFEVPDDVLATWREIGTKGTAQRQDWQQKLEASAERKAFEASLKGVPADLNSLIATAKAQFIESKPSIATRAASGKVLDVLVPAIAELVGGSADLTGSNNTKVKGPEVISADNHYHGQYIHYGVREHGMAAIMNGLALHGGFIPYGGTFLCFADYCRPSIRLSALMKQRVIYVMTHDSIGLGEDGPTHQPVEHVASLRAIPNVRVFRPCDGIETAEAWELAIREENGPAVMVLTRQNLPTLRAQQAQPNMSSKGAYILEDWTGTNLDKSVTLFASGSEVAIAVDAAATLRNDNYDVRVVSVPCLDLFQQQDRDYIKDLIGNGSLKVAVEAGIRQGWDGVIGADGIFIGMNGFGDSAPAEVLYEHFGITANNIVAQVKSAL